MLIFLISCEYKNPAKMLRPMMMKKGMGEL
jgi:hypothetical protein